MSVPNAKIKINKDGVYFEESIDRAEYLISELTRAALRDVGKFIKKRTKEAYYKAFKRKNGTTFNSKGGFGYWVRKREGDLIIGINVAEKDPRGAFWFGWQELGNADHQKQGIFYNTVFNNVDEIRKIEGEYLSYIEDENKALGLINEEDTIEYED